MKKYLCPFYEGTGISESEYNGPDGPCDCEECGTRGYVTYLPLGYGPEIKKHLPKGW